jgi:cobalt transport protein
MRRVWWYVIAIAALVSIIALPFIMFPGQEFQGADDKGSEQTDAEPWFENIITPPEGSEPFLFGLVAFVGVVLMVIILVRSGRKAKRKRGP